MRNQRFFWRKCKVFVSVLHIKKDKKHTLDLTEELHLIEFEHTKNLPYINCKSQNVISTFYL